MAAPRLAPFRKGTRRHFQRVVTATGNASATAQSTLAPILLPKVGFLSAVWLMVRGTATVGASGVTAGVDGLAGLFNRITLTANLGSAAIVDGSGKSIETAARFACAMAPRGSMSALTAGSRTFTYQLRVPVGLNAGSNFEIGLINLQDPQIQAYLNLTMNGFNSAFPPVSEATTDISYTIDVFYEYYEVPDPNRFAMPPRSIVRTLEDVATGLVVGDNVYQMPRMGTLVDYAQLVINNSAYAADTNISAFKMRFNKTNVVEERSADVSRAITGATYPRLPVASTSGVAPTYSEAPAGFQPGIFDWSFFAANGVPEQGDLRDAVDTEEITTLEFITTIAAGVTLASTDTIRHVRRIVQVY